MSFSFNLIFISTLFLILIFQLKSQCLDPNQIDGKCSSCQISLNLYEGSCYSIIDGCLYYKSGTQCLVCSNSYIQVGTNCIKLNQINSSFQNFNASQKEDSMFFKGVGLTQPKADINQEKLTKLWQFLSEKHTELQNMQSSITQVIELVSVQSRVFLFKCSTSNSQAMRVQAGIDYKNRTNEYTYLKIGDLSANILDNSTFIQINKFIKQKYSANLQNTVLFKIQLVLTNLFKLHYYSEFGNHYVSFIQKSPFLQLKQLQNIQDPQTPSALVDFVYSQYPQFLLEQNFTVNKIGSSPYSIYQMTFASQSNVIIQVKNNLYYTLVLDKVSQKQYISSNMSSPSYPIKNLSGSKIVGGYQNFTDINDPIFMTTVNHLLQEYQYLQSAKITKIQYQIVSGTNFIIQMIQPITKDQYLCKVFYSLSGYINVMEIYRNSILIQTQPLAPSKLGGYDYATDSKFSKLLSTLKVKYGIVMPTPYLYVNKIEKTDLNGNILYNYQIVSNTITFLIVNFYDSTPIDLEIMEYIVNGESKLADSLLSKETINQISNVISNFKNWMNPKIIQYIRSTKPKQYIAKIITSQGSFFINFIQMPDSLEVVYFQLLDEKQFCITDTISNQSNFSNIFINYTQLIGILQNDKTNLNGTNLVSVSQAIINKTKIYRLLFADLSNMKQTQIILQYDLVQQNYIIRQNKILNQGYFHLNDLSLYNQALQKCFNAFLSQLINYKPAFSQFNTTNIRIYLAGYRLDSYNNRTQSLTRYTLSVVDNTFKLQTIFQQTFGNCTKFDNNGYCSSCNQSQIGFYSKCYSKIKGCQNQIGSSCLQCQKSYELINNTCINDCSMVL